MYKFIQTANPISGIYKSVLRISDNTSIPISENNTDYQAFLAWIAEGNAPLPPDEPPPAPPEPKIDEKLASVGLTLDDLKTALGIK